MIIHAFEVHLDVDQGSMSFAWFLVFPYTLQLIVFVTVFGGKVYTQSQCDITVMWSWLKVLGKSVGG